MDKRGRQIFANAMHRELFLLVFFAALVPALIATVALFYLIFNIVAEQFGIPEAIVYNLIPAAQRVMGILFFVVPVVLVLIFFISYKITHRMVGPFDRIVRELGEFLESKRKGPIVIRKKDKFQPLVDKINQLIRRVS